MNQILANRGLDSRFVFKVKIKGLCPKLSRSSTLISQTLAHKNHNYKPSSKILYIFLFMLFFMLALLRRASYYDVAVILSKVEITSNNYLEYFLVGFLTELCLYILLKANYYPWFDLVFDPKFYPISALFPNSNTRSSYSPKFSLNYLTSKGQFQKALMAFSLLNITKQICFGNV